MYEASDLIGHYGPLNISFDEDGAMYRLQCPYEPVFVENIKRLSDAVYQPQDKVWLVPVTAQQALKVWLHAFQQALSEQDSLQKAADHHGHFLEVAHSLTGQYGDVKVTFSKASMSYHLVFPYNPKLVEIVRDLPERRFDQHFKRWIVPVRHYRALKDTIFKLNVKSPHTRP